MSQDIPTPCRAPMSPEMAQRYRDAAAMSMARLAVDHVNNQRAAYRRGPERGWVDPAPSGERIEEDNERAGTLKGVKLSETLGDARIRNLGC